MLNLNKRVHIYIYLFEIEIEMKYILWKFIRHFNAMAIVLWC